MPPLALPNLYCLPSSIMNFLGNDGAQLRVDDQIQATGQTITATADALAGATSVSVTPLLFPLLRGSTLEFTGAGLPATAEAVLSTTAKTGDTTLNLVPLAAALNAQCSARDSGVNTALALRLTQACVWATSQVKLWCSGRYNDSDLVNSNSVWRWATALAARWVCRRRGNPAPSSVEKECEEVLFELKQVQRGSLQIEDIGTRTPGWGFISNVTVDLRYDIAKVRAQPSISEGTPTLYPQFVDWDSILLFDYLGF